MLDANKAKGNDEQNVVKILTASCHRSSFPDFVSCPYLRPSKPRHSTTFGALIHSLPSMSHHIY